MPAGSVAGRRVGTLLVVAALAAGGCACVARLATGRGPQICRDVISDSGAAITWIGPPDARDREKLSDWCATVGPLVYEPIPARGVSPSVDRVAIVSWNTHVGAGDLDAVLDRAARGDFTSGERADAVVMLLQEVYRHGPEVPERPNPAAAIPGRIVDALHATHGHDVRRFARERGFALFYAPSMRNGLDPSDPEDRGNAIAATISLSDPAVIELPFGHQRRAVPVATLAARTSDGRAWRLRVADVHLDTALAITRGGPLASRRRQADALVSALNALPFDGPTIVAGDFNTWLGDREPAIRLLRAAYPDAPPLAVATWAGPLGMRAPLDYVFARGALTTMRVQRLPDRFGSDHYPLVAVMSF